MKNLGLLFIIPALLLLYLSCTVRERTNPYDTNTITDINSLLTLSTLMTDQGILIHAALIKNIDFDSIIIFRSIGDSTHFVPMAGSSNTDTVILDASPPSNRPLFYRARLSSDLLTSKLTKPISRVYGKNRYLLLTTFGYSLYELSYDFLDIYKRYDVNYPYYYWATDSTAQHVYLTSYSNNHTALLDLHSGEYKILFDMPSPGPVALFNDYLFVASFQKPVSVNIRSTSGDFIKNISIDDTEPIRFIHDKAKNRLLLVSDSKITVFDESANISDSLLITAGIAEGQLFGNSFFFINRDLNSFKSIDLETKTINTLLTGKFGTSFLVVNDTLWIEEKILEKSVLTKLIMPSTRLFTRDEFINISNIIWNQEMGTIIILEKAYGNLHLYNVQGMPLTKRSFFSDPTEIHIIND